MTSALFTSYYADYLKSAPRNDTYNRHNVHTE